MSSQPVSSAIYQEHNGLSDYTTCTANRFDLLEETHILGVPWSAPYLAINGTDASAHVQDCVPLYTGRPAGYIEFDVTDAVKNWLAGDPNYGQVL